MDIIKHGVDSYGRENIEVLGCSFSLQKIIPFQNWIEKQKTTYNAFLNLNIKDKETMFLRWKWGLSDLANDALENTERHILFMTKDLVLENERDDYKFHFQQKRNFERYCYQVKKDIGLAQLTEEDETPEILNAKKTFNAVGRFS